jgi:hypothetical protein
MGKRAMSIWVLGRCGSAFIDVDTGDCVFLCHAFGNIFLRTSGITGIYSFGTRGNDYKGNYQDQIQAEFDLYLFVVHLVFFNFSNKRRMVADARARIKVEYSGFRWCLNCHDFDQHSK